MPQDSEQKTPEVRRFEIACRRTVASIYPVAFLPDHLPSLSERQHRRATSRSLGLAERHGLFRLLLVFESLCPQWSARYRRRYIDHLMLQPGL